MNDFPDIKLKSLTTFPAQVNDGIGTDVAKVNGAYSINLDYSRFGTIGSLPVPANPHQQVLIYDVFTQQYVLAPLSLLGVTGGIEDVQYDNQLYGRKNLSWVLVPPSIVDVNNDGIIYGRKNSAWVPVPTSGGGGGGIPEVDNTGLTYARTFNNWVPVASSSGIPEAPLSGLTYGRIGTTASWTQVLPIGGGTLSGSLSISAPDALLVLNKAVGTHANLIEAARNGSLRWIMELGDYGTEGGSNTGSDFSIIRCNDAGSVLDAPISISRQTGLMTLNGDPTAPLGVATKNYVDTKVAAIVIPPTAYSDTTVYATRALLQAGHPTTNYVTVLRSYSASATEPSTPALYAKLASAPANTALRGYIQDANGIWWANVESQLWASQFRVSGDTSWTPAIQGMLDYATPGMICNIDVGPTPFYILPSIDPAVVFNLTKSLTLRGGNLYWDGAMGTAIFFLLNGFMLNLKIRDIYMTQGAGGMETLPTDLWVQMLAGNVFGGDVFRMGSGGGGNYVQNLEISGCHFGPTMGYGINTLALSPGSPADAPDHFRGIHIHDNTFWGGMKGMLGDSCTFTHNAFNGCSTPLDAYDGPGATLTVFDDNNCFTNAGTIRWRGGDRLRVTNNNCEHLGPKVVSVSGMFDLDVSQPGLTGTCLMTILRGNHFGCLIVGSGTYAGVGTGFSRIAHFAQTTNTAIEYNTFIATDHTTPVSAAYVIDAGCITSRIGVNDLGGLPGINNGT